MIAYDEATCRDLDAASRREWLETNGLGGYASSCGLNTRRYHGLLMAATKPPVSRMVLLSKLEGTLPIDVNELWSCREPMPRNNSSAGLFVAETVPAGSVSGYPPWHPHDVPNAPRMAEIARVRRS